MRQSYYVARDSSGASYRRAMFVPVFTHAVVIRTRSSPVGGAGGTRVEWCKSREEAEAVQREAKRLPWLESTELLEVKTEDE